MIDWGLVTIIEEILPRVQPPFFVYKCVLGANNLNLYIIHFFDILKDLFTLNFCDCLNMVHTCCTCVGG